MNPQSGIHRLTRWNPKGLTGWILARLHPPSRQPRLAVLDRVMLAPRQSLVLVEAEGMRLLVATSPEGSPAFYTLDKRAATGRIVGHGGIAARGGR